MAKATEGRSKIGRVDMVAGVAELADAQVLGTCVRKDVEVQVLSPAPDRIFEKT